MLILRSFLEEKSKWPAIKEIFVKTNLSRYRCARGDPSNINNFSKGERDENDKIEDPLWWNVSNFGFGIGPNY